MKYIVSARCSVPRPRAAGTVNHCKILTPQPGDLGYPYTLPYFSERSAGKRVFKRPKLPALTILPPSLSGGPESL